MLQPTVAGLIDAVKDGELALPEFQRDYRWPVGYIEELLRSIARGWPIGTLLLLNQADAPGGLVLEPRKIENAPKCKPRPEHLILDGQQRVTALFHAMNGIGDYRFYLDLNEIKRARGFTDEALASVRASQIRRKLGDATQRRGNRILLLEELYSTEQLTDWLNYLDEDDRREFSRLRDDHLSLFREHTVSVEKVSNTLPVEAIAKIFERTNRGFLRLDAFDLMVAIMYPHKFKLRDEWDKAKTADPILEQFGVAPIEILRLVALREHLRQKNAGVKQTVKGVRQSDVLEVKPATVKKEWARAARAYARALKVAESSWGVIRQRIVPAETMLLPLADALYSREVRSGSANHKKLGQWFWGAIFARQYGSAANTQAVSDAEALRVWLKPRSRKEPKYVRDFKISPDDFVRVEEGNEILVRGLTCLLNTQGARTWSKTDGGAIPPPLESLDSELAIHHVFPKKFMSRLSRDRLRQLPNIDAPANQVLITASLNGRLLNQPPEYALDDSDVDDRGIKSHQIDTSKMKGTKYKPFVNARAAALVPIVDRAVKGY